VCSTAVPVRLAAFEGTATVGYDGFTSHSHAADGRFAPALQRGLQRFAKPGPAIARSVVRDVCGLLRGAVQTSARTEPEEPRPRIDHVQRFEPVPGTRDGEGGPRRFPLSISGLARVNRSIVRCQKLQSLSPLSVTYACSVSRRRPGVLLDLEERMLEIGCARVGTDAEWFYGFALATDLEGADGSRKLLGHGTLYKALERLERNGYLESRWEHGDPRALGRPRRREYRVTSTAAGALQESRRLRQHPGAPRWSPA
jgi:PadR family transcriptional regulator PadR